MTSAKIASSRTSGDLIALDNAMKLAWWIWLGLLAAPFAVFFVAIWRILGGGGAAADPVAAQRWFVATMLCLVIVVPSALFFRSHLFKPYWSGHVVPPGRYLAGMTAVWASLAIAGLSAALACLLTRTLVPNILPALLALLLFECHWPNGHAMSRPLHNERDPAEYEDPR
jgi:hypothetical protein